MERSIKYFLVLIFSNTIDNVLSYPVIDTTEAIHLLHADTAEYDNGSILFKGNVSIKYDKKDIFADKITLIGTSNNIYANGLVKVIDDQGNVCTADAISIEAKDKKSIFKNAKLILADRSNIKADTATFASKEYFNMQEAEYSSCYNCIIGNDLTWKIKAKEVKQEKDTITYKNAIFYFLGLPLISLPYFSHNSFHIKRKSGFLTPLVGHTSEAGFSLVPQYLYYLSKSQELIFKPILTTRIDPIFWTSYKHRFYNGIFNLDTSYTGIKSISKPKKDIGEYEKKEREKMQRNKYRGHIFANLKYNLTPRYRFFSNINLASDKYYLKKIPFIKDNVKRLMESNLGLERFTEKNHSAIRMIYFQTMRPEENAGDIPLVFPVISHNASHDFYNSSLNIDIFAVRLDFPNSHDTQKIFANIGISKDIINTIGQVLEINVKCMTSFNKISYKDKTEKNYSLNEVAPLGSINLKWPWKVSFNSDFWHTIEPMIGITGICNKKADTDKFNDQYTSLSLFELNDSNFMEGLRSNFCGQTNETSHIPYGLRTNSYYKSEHLMDFIIGRSININRQKYIMNDCENRNSRQSNIIFRGDFLPERKTNLFISGSYNNSYRRFQHIDSGFRINHPTANFYVGVFSCCSANDFKKNINGIHSTLAIKITKTVTLKYSTIFGEKNNLLKSSIGITYKNECFSSELLFTRNRFRSIDIEPSKSICLNLSFRNLGSGKVSL